MLQSFQGLPPPQPLLPLNFAAPETLARLKVLEKAILPCFKLSRGLTTCFLSNCVAISDKFLLTTGLKDRKKYEINNITFKIIFSGLKQNVDFQILEAEEASLSPVPLDMAPEGHSLQMTLKEHPSGILQHTTSFLPSPHAPPSPDLHPGAPRMSFNNGGVYAIRINGEDVPVSRIYSILKDTMEASDQQKSETIARILHSVKVFNLPEDLVLQRLPPRLSLPHELASPEIVARIKTLEAAVFPRSKSKAACTFSTHLAISETLLLGTGLYISKTYKIKEIFATAIFCGKSRNLDFQILEIEDGSLSPVSLDMCPEGPSIQMTVIPGPNRSEGLQDYRTRFLPSPEEETPFPNTHPGAPMMSLNSGGVHAIRINGEDVPIGRIVTILTEPLASPTNSEKRKTKLKRILSSINILNPPADLARFLTDLPPQTIPLAPQQVNPRKRKSALDNQEAPVQEKRQVIDLTAATPVEPMEQSRQLLSNQTLVFESQMASAWQHQIKIYDTRAQGVGSHNTYNIGPSPQGHPQYNQEKGVIYFSLAARLGEEYLKYGQWPQGEVHARALGYHYFLSPEEQKE